jgi:hypothetical protein
MEVVHGYRDLPRPLVRPAIAIGNFDGVHRRSRRAVRDRPRRGGRRRTSAR